MVKTVNDITGEELYPGELVTTQAAKYLGRFPSSVLKSHLPYRTVFKNIRLYKITDLQLVKRNPKYFNPTSRRRFRRQELVFRRYLDGHSQGQIAKELNFSQGDVSKLLNGVKPKGKCPCCGKHA